MATGVATEPSTLPAGFAKWAKTYFKKEAAQDDGPLDLDALFNNQYIRFRRSVEGQLANAAKVPELKAKVATQLKAADEEESVEKLQALVAEMKRELADRRAAVETKLNTLYDDLIYAQLDLRRDPNEARDTIRNYLKDWDIGAAEAELNRFEEQIKRAKPLGLRDMKSLQERHEENNLQSAKFARNAQQAIAVATRLIGGDGKILMDGGMWKELAMVDSDDLPSLIEEIENSPESELPQSRHALALLKRLSADKDLRDKLEGISKPADQESTASNLIRATLNLPAGTEVTDAHARQAALSGLMFQTRQTQVGSCFMTLAAVSVQQNRPGQFLDDISDLFTNGKLSRTIRHNGADVTIDVPLTKEMLAFNVQKETQVARTDSNLHMAPDMIASMNALGIPADEQKQALEQAARMMRADRALDAALAKIDDQYCTAPNTKEAMKKSALDLLRADSGLSIRNALSQTFIARNLKLTTRNNTAGRRASNRRKSDALAETNSYDAPAGSDAFSPQELIAQMANDRLPPDQREAAARGATDAFLGQQDNFVQRAWEYTMATMDEKHPGNTSVKGTLCNGYADVAEETMKESADALAMSTPWKDWAKLRAKDLADKFFTRVNARFDSRYDPTVTTKSGTAAQDGSSTFGGVCLYDGQTRIDSKAQFEQVLTDALDQALQDVLGSWDVALTEERNVIDSLAGDLRAKIPTEPFQQKLIDKICGTPAAGDADDPRDKMAFPWTEQKGGFDQHTLQLYQNSPDPLQMARSPATADTPEKVATFLVETMLTMGVDRRLSSETSEQAVIPCNTAGIHAFNLTPGNPILQSLLREYDDADAAMQAFKNKEVEKQNQRESHEIAVSDPPAGALKKLIDGMIVVVAEDDQPELAADILADVIAAHPDKATFTQVQTIGSARVTATMQSWGVDAAEIPGIVDSAVAGADAQFMEQVIPKDEYAPMIDLVMQKQSVPKDQQEKLRKAIADRLDKDAVDRDAFAVIIDEEMAKLSLSPDAEKIKMSMIGPRGLVFADSNWGGGDDKTLFSMVVNPRTKEMEMWQMSEDGTGARKMDDTWINTTWQVYSDPSEYDGNIGDADWERKRGEAQDKLNQCLEKRVGNATRMVQALEIADKRFQDSQKDKGEKALQAVTDAADAALALVPKIEAATDSLNKIVGEIKTEGAPESKQAQQVVQRLLRQVEGIRLPTDVPEILSGNAKLINLLKQADLDNKVDLVAVLSA